MGEFGRVSNIGELAQEFGVGTTRQAFSIGESGTSIPGLNVSVTANNNMDAVSAPSMTA